MRKKPAGRSPYLRPLLVLIGVLLVILSLQKGLKRKKEEAPAEKAPLRSRAVAHLNWTHLVYEIRQDPYNPDLVWFGTDEGLKLHRQSDATTETFSVHQGLPDDQVTAIDFEPGAIWIGTLLGVARLDRTTRKVTVPDTLRKDPLRVLDLYRDGENLLIGTAGRGLLRLGPLAAAREEAAAEEEGAARGDAEGRGLRLESLLAPQGGFRDSLQAERDVYCIASALGTFYLGHGRGKISMGRPEGPWQGLSFPEAASVSRETQIYDILPLGPEIWVATSDAAVWRYDFRSKAFTQYRPRDGFMAKGAYALLHQDGGIFAGTARGIFRFDLEQEAWMPLPEPEDEAARQVTALERSAEEKPWFWFGAAGRGAGRCAVNRVGWTEVPLGLAREGVDALETVGDAVWTGYGYKGGYADLLTENLVFFRNYNLWVGQKLESVSFIKRQGSRVFMGAFTGFGYYDTAEAKPRWKIHTFKDKEPIQDVNDVTVWQKGFALSSGDGLYRLEGAGRLGRLRGTEGTYYGPLAARGDSLLAGTLGGGVQILVRMGQDPAAVKRLAEFGAGKIDLVTALVEAEPGIFWVGTRRQGLWALDLRGAARFDSLAVPGLDESYVTSLLREEGSGRIWVATREKGLYGRDPKTGAWKALDPRHFLQSGAVHAIGESPRYLWLGDGLGLTRIDKDSLHTLLNRGRPVPAGRT